ncbi:MAG: type II toxin-antitoxin system HicA family toxin [Candidatus Rokubacteria bacterium]|nr:type II toxin-antitoxin system HicA family toxin [Candidatus Rokubacteria bacterium]
MTRLPAVSGREAVRAFAKIGYREDRQTGSHIILRRQDPPNRRLTVPDHKELARGTLRNLIREAGLSVEEFVALL